MRDVDLVVSSALDAELGVLVATLLDGTREWRKSLGDVTPEAILWQPYPNGPSIGGELLHLVSCEMYWLEHLALGLPFDETQPAVAYDLSMDQYIPHWPTPPAQPLEWYYALQDDTHRRIAELIAGHNQPMSWHSRGEERYTFRWILAHAIHHDSYHGGQAVLLHELWKQTPH